MEHRKRAEVDFGEGQDWQVARDGLKLQGVCDLYKVQIG